MLWWRPHFLFLIGILPKIISITIRQEMSRFVWILTSIDLWPLTKHFEIFLRLDKSRTSQVINIFVEFEYPGALRISIYPNPSWALDPLAHPAKLERILLRNDRIIFSLSIKFLLIGKLQRTELHPAIIRPSTIRILSRSPSRSVWLDLDKFSRFLDF